MSRRPLRLLASIAAALLVLGTAACSDDDSTSADRGATSSADAANGNDQDSDGDDEALDIGELTGGSDRPFGVSRDDLAKSIGSATSADRWEVEGETIYLFYGSGTYDSMTAAINCSAALTLQSDEDRVVLVYPDGEVDCNEQS